MPSGNSMEFLLLANWQSDGQGPVYQLKTRNSLGIPCWNTVRPSMKEPTGQLVKCPLLELLGSWVVSLVVLEQVYGVNFDFGSARSAGVRDRPGLSYFNIAVLGSTCTHSIIRDANDAMRRDSELRSLASPRHLRQHASARIVRGEAGRSRIASTASLSIIV